MNIERVKEVRSRKKQVDQNGELLEEPMPFSMSLGWIIFMIVMAVTGFHFFHDIAHKLFS